MSRALVASEGDTSKLADAQVVRHRNTWGPEFATIPGKFRSISFMTVLRESHARRSHDMNLRMAPSNTGPE